MTKNKNRRYPVAIDDLLVEFDEMDYCPMNLSGSDPVKEAIAWRDRLRHELDLLLDEKSAIERRAVEEFAEKLKKLVFEQGNPYNVPYEEFSRANVLFMIIDDILKEYKDEQEK